MRKIQAKNLTAQLAYRAVGNPPSTMPNSAISNAFPGLEMDIRNLWRRIFVGVELTEGSNFVISVDKDMPENVRDLAGGHFALRSVEGVSIVTPVNGPTIPGGPTVPLNPTSGSSGDPTMALEWSNVLAALVTEHQGKQVQCRFLQVGAAGNETVEVTLTMRRVFHVDPSTGEQHAVISQDMALPGQMSQSLCSPWQNDYRECACFYWAASRPDYVNVEPTSSGVSTGNNWMEKDRNPESPAIYIVDDRKDSRLVSYNDLFLDWEKQLKFVIGGRDADE